MTFIGFKYIINWHLILEVNFRDLNVVLIDEISILISGQCFILPLLIVLELIIKLLKHLILHIDLKFGWNLIKDSVKLYFQINVCLIFGIKPDQILIKLVLLFIFIGVM